MTTEQVRPARWPWLALASFLAFAVVGTVLVSLNDESIGQQVPFLIAFSLFGAVGALVLSRDRRNRIGLLLLYGSFTTAASYVGGEVVTWLAGRGTTEGPVVVVPAILSGVGWLIGLLPVLFLLPLIFPDGRLLSPRWRLLVAGLCVLFVFLFIVLLFASPKLTGSTEDVSIRNPLYMRVFDTVQIPDAVFGFGVTGGLGATVASLVLRYRRSEGVARQQMRWVAFAMVLLVVSFILSTLLAGIFNDNPWVDPIVTGGAFIALPVSIGIAILKYRLYDLDVVIRKTLVYAILAALATFVYLAVVVGIGALVGSGSSFLTMVAAVIVAVTFQPARQRITHVANRLVYGRRATPYEVLSEFSERVGGTYATEDVLPRMARVLAEGTGADHAIVWIKVGDDLRAAAVWPTAEARPGPVRLTNGDLPSLPDADVALPVRHHDEFLGALAIRKPPSEPPTPAEEKLMADLAAQAGLVLRNERLTSELRARLDDLQAAQKRIVAAQDEERRRLERNIHDGAQQQLVALAVKARLAQGVAERDPVKAAEILGQIAAETQGALEDLRDLARGIYPPLLAEKGLVAAVEAQARKAPQPVTVEADGVGRYTQETEAAAYFCVLESMQNAAKHARADEVTVRLAAAGTALTFEVHDDGVGFDPASTRYGTGLQGIADRLAALGGELEVRSRPGLGTTLTGRLPVEVSSPEPAETVPVPS